MLRLYTFLYVFLSFTFEINCVLNSTEETITSSGEEIEDTTTNSVILSPEITSKACFQQCTNRNLELYSSCMKGCSPNWPFSDIGSNCLEHVPKRHPSVACHPIFVNHSFIIVDRDDERSVFININWKPCPSGLEVLTGFEVLYLGTSYWRYFCYFLPLRSNLSLNHADRNMIFSFTLPTEPLSLEKADINLVARPMDSESQNGITIPVKAPSCHTVHGPYSCKCKLNKYFRINVTVQGYSVTIQFKKKQPCRQVRLYSVEVGFTREGYPVAVKRKDYPSNSVPPYFSHTFHNVYNLKDSTKSLHAMVLTLRNVGQPVSYYKTIVITAWKPPLPNVTFLSDSTVRISFVLPTDYDIAQYQFRLTQQDIVDDQITTNKTVFVQTFMANQTNGSILSAEYFGLRSGSYFVQVKEVRVDLGKYLKDSVWGPNKSFELLPEPEYFAADNNWSLEMIISIVVATIIIVLIVLFLFLWKKGYCQPFRKSLPVSLVQWLDTQTFTWTKKTILIIWQADFRSTELMKKQSEIISCFAAFLRNVCGLNVILDLHEEPKLVRGIGNWVQTSYSKSDLVVFVCPHFDYLQDEIHNGSLTGNFKRMYSYMENDLGDRSKFATVVFPYSSIDSTSATKYLKKMTSVFMLMEQIEEFDFHIQGMSRSNCIGCHSANNAKDNKYEKTPLGKALSNALKDFQEMLGDYPNYCSINGSNESFEVEEEDRPLMQEGLSKSNSNSLQDVNDESQPVMVHCLKSIEAPTDSDLDPETTSPAPIAPFVENPEEVLKVINQKSEMNLPKEEEEYCPYHDEVSSVEITLPGNENPIDDVAQERSSSPVTPVDTLQYGDSHGVGDSAYNSTKI